MLASVYICVYREGLHKDQGRLQMGAVLSKFYTLLESQNINCTQPSELPSLFVHSHSSIFIIFDSLLISIVGAYFL